MDPGVKIDEEVNDRMLERVYPSKPISSQVAVSNDLVKTIRTKRLCHIQSKARAGGRWDELGHVLGGDQGLHLFDPDLPDSVMEHQSNAWWTQLIAVFRDIKPWAPRLTRAYAASVTPHGTDAIPDWSRRPLTEPAKPVEEASWVQARIDFFSSSAMGLSDISVD